MKAVILYATRSGTSEYLANGLLAELEKNKIDADCNDIATIDFETEFTQENDDKVYLFVITTVEGGNPTESLEDFYDWIMNEDTTTSNFKYSIFGVGDSRYAETYQKVSRQVKERMSTVVGEPVIPCAEGDNKETIHADFDEWTAKVKQYFSYSSTKYRRYPFIGYLRNTFLV